ncbi:MAG: hypothetical protein OWV35_10440 [Firmicutes bacterium]|nr:hypothetical protein [Bacillota bacterium]
MQFETLEAQLQQRADWVVRRQRHIPNNPRLFVLACMDERLPVEEALGIGRGMRTFSACRRSGDPMMSSGPLC